jgi:HD-like signal output (HDOD) protein
VDDGLAKIHRMIEDPDSDLSEVARLINLEICTITGHVLRLTNDFVVDWSWRLKVYAIAIKVLRKMRESLMDTGFLNKRDVLNLEGEKFLFVVKQIHSRFGKAITAAGFPEETRNNILKQYRDIAAVEEPAMCLELRKMGKSPRRD